MYKSLILVSTVITAAFSTAASPELLAIREFICSTYGLTTSTSEAASHARRSPRDWTRVTTHARRGSSGRCATRENGEASFSLFLGGFSSILFFFFKMYVYTKFVFMFFSLGFEYVRMQSLYTRIQTLYTRYIFYFFIFFNTHVYKVCIHMWACLDPNFMWAELDSNQWCDPNWAGPKLTALTIPQPDPSSIHRLAQT